MRCVALVYVLSMLAFAVPASAQTALEQAKALTNEASVQYKLGRASVALEGYMKAYEKYPTPGLLFNIAQCHRMLTNYEQAIYFYRGYLRDKPDAANRTDVETLIRDTEHDLEAERARRAEAEARAAEEARDRAKADEARARAAEEEARAAEERAHARSAPLPPPPASSAAAGTPGSGARRIAGVGLGAAGVVLLGTGVYFGLHASSDSSTISQLASQRAAWSAHDESVYGDGTRSAHVANALYVVGAATVAAGGVLAFLGWPKAAAAPPVVAAIAPVVSARSSDSACRGASLVLSGSF
jgi:tetratricopeptide (TPR) repeat protein